MICVLEKLCVSLRDRDWLLKYYFDELWLQFKEFKMGIERLRHEYGTKFYWQNCGVLCLSVFITTCVINTLASYAFQFIFTHYCLYIFRTGVSWIGEDNSLALHVDEEIIIIVVLRYTGLHLCSSDQF